MSVTMIPVHPIQGVEFILKFMKKRQRGEDRIHRLLLRSAAILTFYRSNVTKWRSWTPIALDINTKEYNKLNTIRDRRKLPSPMEHKACNILQNRWVSNEKHGRF